MKHHVYVCESGLCVNHHVYVCESGLCVNHDAYVHVYHNMGDCMRMHVALCLCVCVCEHVCVRACVSVRVMCHGR